MKESAVPAELAEGLPVFFEWFAIYTDAISLK